LWTVKIGFCQNCLSFILRSIIVYVLFDFIFLVNSFLKQVKKVKVQEDISLIPDKENSKQVRKHKTGMCPIKESVIKIYF